MLRLSRGPSPHRRHPAVVVAAGADVPQTPDPIYP
ncbi:hypothetical protein A2U01_0068602 [Trifolium medium]|uniref:Uncharacterized protein n=1 Tax=Trifolium medium TaxID=97028 RepID=A0A392SEP0_9FABA|nr:hypothetical protein [Trifolium medium]